jgi:uncharacterized membrane protein
MNKEEFINALEKGLKKANISEIKDIIGDYQEYFYRQLQLGKKEEDISRFIGDIDSIVSEYKSIEQKDKHSWFSIVGTTMVALPLLIISYGIVIVLFGAMIASWAIAVYYMFNLSSLAFMPNIPLFPKIFYILFFISFAVFFFSLAYKFFVTVLSMTKQYIVKQSIVIGEFKKTGVYDKLFKYSFLIGMSLFIISFIISVVTSKSFEFWHTWDWF